MSEQEVTLSVRLCAASSQHTMGTGHHDASRYGACSLHEQSAHEVLASDWLAEAASAARVEALEDAESRLLALASRDGYDPWARAIIGLDAVKAIRGESWPS